MGRDTFEAVASGSGASEVPITKVEMFGASWAAGTGSDGLPTISTTPGSVSGSRSWEKLAALLHATPAVPSVVNPSINTTLPYPPIQRPTNLAIGGSLMAQPTKGVTGTTPNYSGTGDGGVARVLQLIAPPVTRGDSGQPYLSPVSLLVMLSGGYNDFATGSSTASATQIPVTGGNPLPVKGALRTIISRFLTARIYEDTDPALSYSGTWNPFGAFTSKLQNSGVGFAYTNAINSAVTLTCPPDMQNDLTVAAVFPVGSLNDGTGVQQGQFGGTWSVAHKRGTTTLDTKTLNCVDYVVNGATGQVAPNSPSLRFPNCRAGDTITATVATTPAGYMGFDCFQIEGAGGLVCLPLMPTMNNAGTVTSYNPGVVEVFNQVLVDLAAEFPNAFTSDLNLVMKDDVSKLIATTPGAPDYHPNNWGQIVIALQILKDTLSAADTFGDAALGA